MILISGREDVGAHLDEISPGMFISKKTPDELRDLLLAGPGFEERNLLPMGENDKLAVF